ncbi:MAG TPA: hypothetical protein PJ982_03535 [Lacipirellulaceae bacterium]|nr:hypothetical protein [Lacipirellulaceae bacterium]
MTAAQRLALVALAASLFAPAALRADEVSYVDEGGIRYQVTKRTVQRQVPATEMSEQTQTYYRQQVTSDTLQHQQLYSVPVTQYQLVSRMHGRWNPFVTPYWTHHYEPVTTWTQQTGMVSIPINRVSWAPETRTVQAPTTTYRLANEEMVTRVAIGPTPSGNRSTMVAAAGPSAMLAARPSSSAPIAAAPSAGPAVAAAPTPAGPAYGGTALTGDPPRQATGWQSPSDSRYGSGARR